MTVADIVTQPVVSVHPSTSVGEAIRIMLDHRISGLPVVSDSGQLVGIVSEGDLLRRGNGHREVTTPLVGAAAVPRAPRDGIRAHAWTTLWVEPMTGAILDDSVVRVDGAPT